MPLEVAAAVAFLAVAIVAVAIAAIITLLIAVVAVTARKAVMQSFAGLLDMHDTTSTLSGCRYLLSDCRYLLSDWCGDASQSCQRDRSIDEPIADRNYRS